MPQPPPPLAAIFHAVLMAGTIAFALSQQVFAQEAQTALAIQVQKIDGIIEGEVELIANGQTVKCIGLGEVFGIDAFLEEQPRPYTAIAALSESVLRQLPQKHERRLHRCGCWLL